MRRKIWKIKELDSRVKSLAGELKLSPFLVQVLLNRGVAEEDFTSFLNPAPEFLHSPYLLPDINKAAQRVRKAIKGKEKVLVFGDYDVDGITSLAIFHEFAKDFPGTFSFYIPHRIEEGYGLNTAAIVKAKEDGVGLIIAFDCGTNAQPEISTARSLNIDIIVIDHHHPKDNLNPGFALVNPKLKSSKYPFSDLSAGALSFKFLQVLTGSDCHPVLDLVALSLVCDVTPLVGENRSLLHEGLKVIRKSRRPALRALCQATRIKQEYIDTFHIGYILGPRINASGRVAHAEDSLQLFLASDDKTAFDLALKLGEYNQLRKNIELQILREVEERIREDIAGVGAIVVSHNDWHPGVLGIVASRLKEKYYKPSFVISFDRDIGRGSGRSIAGVHLIEMLDKCADSLLVYGGHSRAAGVEIRKDELDNF